MRRAHFTWLRTRRGFTISELMAGIGLVALVGTATTSVVVGTLGSYGYQTRMVDAQTDVASAMALLQDDLRAAGYIVDGCTQSVFQQFTSGTTADSIQFIGDVNSDNVTERITYALSGGRLMRTQDTWTGADWTLGTAQPVANHVTTFALKAYEVDPCTATLSQLTGAQVLAAQQLTFFNATISGTATYKGKTQTKTLSSDVAERQGNVLPQCS